ncbi:phage minor capsid protein [Microbispora amethystogenes]|uniref:phage minor capsid protein n=1 Tax=Microbispora amethystogenes TaxID=1427754 RepID=UPI0033FBF4FE
MAYAGRKVQPGEVAERLDPSSVDDSSPVGRALAQAEALAALYADAEEKLFETIRKALLAGRSEPQYAGNRFNDVRRLRKQAEQVVNRLQKLAEKAARDGITGSWEEGLERAKDELAHLGDKDLITPGQGVAELVEQALGKLKSANEAALRTVDDIYRQVVAEVSGRALIGAETRREATVRALQKFAAKGITMYSGERTWSISAYAEMATRTAMSRAAVDGHLKTLQDNGRDLVMVSRPPYTCPICKPWEGKILSNGGQVGKRAERSLATGNEVTVNVAGTVAEARAAGLQHPNCRHNLMAYLPGLTKPPPKPPTDTTYEDTQKQRYLERQIRGWKRKAAAAPPGSKERETADQQVKAYREQMNTHLARTGLLRQSDRERVRPDETAEPNSAT